MLQRFYRLCEAHIYLGMGVESFNKEVRPFVAEIRKPGFKGVFFDRLDLDRWADTFKMTNGSPGTKLQEEKCLNIVPVLEKEKKYGKSIKPSAESKFAKALELVI